MGKNLKIYVDDLRTPLDDKWIIVRNFYQFIEAVESIGLENIGVISLDHDLGIFVGEEEKTGYDCAKWLVNLSMDKNIHLPQIYVHSANTVGLLNIINYVNNYLHFCEQPETCSIGYTAFKI